jgi:hypothetical protein
MITRWLKLEGGWRSITANERIPWDGGCRHKLGGHEIRRWWQNELALTAMPCFRLTAGIAAAAGAAHGAAHGGGNAKTFFTLFSVIDRMHRPQ